MLLRAFYSIYLKLGPIWSQEREVCKVKQPDQGQLRKKYAILAG